MSWFLGAGLGLLRGGPLGALVGGTAQHFFSKRSKKNLNKNLAGILDETAFSACLVGILTKISLTARGLSASQARVIHKFFAKNLGYEADGLKVINEMIREVRRVNPDMGYLAEKLSESTGGKYRLLVLALAYQVSLVDGGGSEETQKEIDSLAEYFKIDPNKHNEVRLKYSLEELRTPYMILDIDSAASADEIKKAYRKKLRELHPDRAIHLGPEKVEEAHIKFLEAQSAFQELQNIRGIKF
jgi:DnaJ like chaperone protein